MKGTIKRRSEGSYQLRYDAPPDGSGKRRQINETIRGTRREAEAVLRQRLVTADSGGYIEKNRQTVAGYLAQWLDTIAVTVTPRTSYGYSGHLRRYVNPALGEIGLQTLHPQTIQALYAELLERLSPRTVLGVHRILHKAFSDAVMWGMLSGNPTDAVTPPRFKRKEMILWDRAQLAAFLKAAEGSPFRDSFELLVLSGLRRSELGGLQWSAVDLGKGELRVTRTLQRIGGQGLVVGSPKTIKSRRNVALSPRAIAVLRRMKSSQIQHRLLMGKGWQDSGHVLTNVDGSPTDPTRMTPYFARIVKRSGLPHLSLHGLRHMHASLLLMNGVHLKIVSERLGHSSIALTADTYSHILPGLQEEAVRGLDSLLSGFGD